MCWMTIKSKHKHPNVAKRDIVVGKFVKIDTGNNGNGVMKPLIFDDDDFIYKFNERYTSKFRFIDTEKCKAILNGLHSLSIKKGKECKYPHMSPEKDIRYIECVIPKGATYYRNEFGEYVSNELIPIKLG